METWKAVLNRAVFSVVIGGQLKLGDALRGERKANEAAGVARHEVDGFGRNFFGGDDEIAFVFAVFIVDENDEFAFAKVF